MAGKGSVLRVYTVVIVACTLPTLGVEARSQGTRVLLTRPVNAKAVPPDAARAFKLAITEAGADVTFVATVAEATDLIELTNYEWKPDEERGVSQTSCARC